MHYSKGMLLRRLFTMFLLITAVPMTLLMAQDVDVDREELQTQADATIEFENYQGPQENVSSADQIRGIGATLSRFLSPEPGSSADYFDRYTIFRGLDPNDPEGLDADILSIHENATVNHIDNVRRIISGYLSDAFGYSGSDADLIAELTTIYNAVYRGNMEFFDSRYKRIVFDYLAPSRAGISTSYREWPGGTQLVIPLSTGAEPGDLDAVSPLQLADPGVIEDLRQRRDMGIETRKDMIAFIERVIQEREEQIAEERQAIEVDRQRIEERREEIEEERAQIEEETPEVAAEEEAVAEEGAPERRESEAEAETEEPTPEERIAALDEEEKALEQEEEELQEREAALEEEEEEVEELTERAQELYEETSEDQEQLIEEQGRQEEAAAAEPVLFFLVEADDASGRLVLVDRRNGDILSEYTGTRLLRGSFPRYQGSVLAILQGRGAETRAVLLDEESLKVVEESERGVYRGTTIAVAGEALYMVVQEEGSWRIGRFSEALRLEQTSVVAVNPNTDIVLSEGRLLAQDPRGGILLLDAQELRITR